MKKKRTYFHIGLIGQKNYQAIKDTSEAASNTVFMLGLSPPGLYGTNNNAGNVKENASYQNGKTNFENEVWESKGGIHVLPNAEDLKMFQTVQNHMNDVIKKGPNEGQLSRPYIDSDGTTLLLEEIMESADPVSDAILQSGLRWDVSGTFRGSTGTWELVVDTGTNTVVHLNFVAQ